MADGPSDSRRFLLMALGAAWVMAFVFAFFAAASIPSAPSELDGEIDRVGIFLDWQAIAGIIAIAVFGVSLIWEKGSVVRRYARYPLFIALAQALVVGGVMVFRAI